jgi:very-short-patch-repair endonuclease
MEKYNKTLDECMLKSSRDAWGEKIKGENNGAYNHGGRFSPYSKKFIKYDDLTDEEKEEKISGMYKNLSERLTDGTGRMRTQVEYWTKQGFTEDEAIDKISKLQVTFSLEKCIEKYGEEEGQKRWKERQKKWLNSFDKQNYSMISQKLFWSIYEQINNKYKQIYFAQLNPRTKKLTEHKNFEYKLDVGKSYCKLDFFIKDINKCIEFDGDYWHGESRGNKTRDEQRNQLIEESGIKIFHIKERDYKIDPDKCLMDCMSFIYSK